MGVGVGVVLEVRLYIAGGLGAVLVRLARWGERKGELWGEGEGRVMMHEDQGGGQ